MLKKWEQAKRKHATLNDLTGTEAIGECIRYYIGYYIGYCVGYLKGLLAALRAVMKGQEAVDNLLDEVQPHRHLSRESLEYWKGKQ